MMKREQCLLLFLCFLETNALFASSNRATVVSSIHKFTSPNRKLAAVNVDSQQETGSKVVDIEDLKIINEIKSGTEARNLLDVVLPSEDRLYGSLNIIPGVSEKGLPDAELALQTKIRNDRNGIIDLIELNGNKDADRAALALFCIMVASVGSAISVNQNFPGPEIVRFTLVWILSFAPLGFVGLGIATPEKIQTFLVQLQREIFPVYKKRMVQHEAGHFLMGHLLGLPIKGYSANAVKNAVEFFPLNDPQVGRSRVRQLGFDESNMEDLDSEEYIPASSNAPYFSKEGRGGDLVEQRSVFRNNKNYTDNAFLKLPTRNEPTKSWPYRGFDERTLDKLTVISVAGVCAEILAFGNGEGGYADFAQLRQLFNSAQSKLDDKNMENRIRYALGYTMCQLRLHLGALDSLAEEMERGASVAECIAAIENCENVSGNDGFMEYDAIRRERFCKENMGFLERIFLEGLSEKEEEKTNIIEGIGGGGRKKVFKITGDDPLYYALGIAFIFFVWASNGGLSLH